MKALLVAFSFWAVCDVIFAGMAFPSGLPYETVDEFRKINPNIKWDESNYLVDISGPYTLCSKVGVNNAFEVKKLSRAVAQLFGSDGVGGLISDTYASGGTASAVAKDIRRVVAEWIHKEPFKSQIKEAKTFGCSVQPVCRGRTVVGCLFSPKADFMSGDDSKDEGKQQAVALTPEQYSIAEESFRSINPNVVWDRSHFLENLSGFETRCSMIGRTSWNYAVAAGKAKEYGYHVGFLFGSASRSGNTDDDVRSITRAWMFTEEGRKQVSAAKEVGCSMAQSCPNKKIVIACLISPGV